MLGPLHDTVTGRPRRSDHGTVRLGRRDIEASAVLTTSAAGMYVTGRVVEAGNGRISAPRAWQPGPQIPLPPLMSPEAADALLPRVLASAVPPPEVLTSENPLGAGNATAVTCAPQPMS